MAVIGFNTHLTGLSLRGDVLQHLFMRVVVVMRLAWLEVLIKYANRNKT